jgi:hypothetical protein
MYAVSDQSSIPVGSHDIDTKGDKGESKMKRKTGKTFFAVVLALSLLIFVGTAIAQDSADTMRVLVEKIKADKRLLVSENLQLTDSEAKVFWPVYEKYQAELFVLRGRLVQLISDYATAYDKMTSNKAKKLLDENMAIQTLRPRLNKDYLPRFRQILPDTKVVRYYQIENKIDAALNWELADRIPLMKTANE